MNVLYLYSRVMPYTIAGLKALMKLKNIQIHLVHYKISNNTPYQLPDVKDLNYYDESNLELDQLIGMITQLRPKYLFITGWGSKKYLKVAKRAKALNIPVITGCDTQWRGDIKQIGAVLFSKILVRKYFDYMMVAGRYQYEYARLLGFSKKKILMPLYSADLDLFDSRFNQYKISKEKLYPRNILFVGRFEQMKGIDLLLDSFFSLKDRKGWTLTLIGNGSLKAKIKQKVNKDTDIIIKDFMQPAELAREIEKAGLFCLPSTYEPWGVVIQEFALAGLPLICSDSCGAATEFVRSGYNGYIFKNRNLMDLKEKLQTIVDHTDEILYEYSNRSNKLGKKIDPETYASNFMKFL